MKTKAKPRVDPLADLTDGEQRCQEALADGEWDPSLLFDGYEVNPMLGSHPGMEWRLQNPDARLPT